MATFNKKLIKVTKQTRQAQKADLRRPTGTFTRLYAASDIMDRRAADVTYLETQCENDEHVRNTDVTMLET